MYFLQIYNFVLKPKHFEEETSVDGLFSFRSQRTRLCHNDGPYSTCPATFCSHVFIIVIIILFCCGGLDSAIASIWGQGSCDESLSQMSELIEFSNTFLDKVSGQLHRDIHFMHYNTLVPFHHKSQGWPLTLYTWCLRKRDVPIISS